MNKYEEFLKEKDLREKEKEDIKNYYIHLLLDHSDTLLKFGLISGKTLSKIHPRRDTAQLIDVVNDMAPKLIEILDNIAKKEYKPRFKEYNEKEIARLRKLNSDLILENKKARKELNKYRTPAKNITNEVNGYIELLLKEPDKKPTVDSLADFSKGKSFQAARSTWAELIKSYNFLKSLHFELEKQEYSTWDKISKYNRKIEILTAENRQDNNNKTKTSNEEKIYKYKNKIDKLTVIANTLKPYKDYFKKTIDSKEQDKLKRLPSLDSMITKERISDFMNMDFSDLEYKGLLGEIKSTILNYLQNN